MRKRTWAIIAGLFAVGAVGNALDGETESEATRAADTTATTAPAPELIPMPNLIGMSGRDAQALFKKQFPESRSLTEYAEAQNHAQRTRCTWTNPDGTISSADTWTVRAMSEVIDTTVPQPYPTVPLEPESMRANVSDTFVLLHLTPPEGVWCEPYSQSTAGTTTNGKPNIDLPNPNRKGGEPWWCRRHRLC